MKITIYSNGDVNVGIGGLSTSFDLDDEKDSFTDIEFHEKTRAEVISLFRRILHDKVNVVFEDEPVDCARQSKTTCA
jgi:hypothetical protein